MYVIQNSFQNPNNGQWSAQMAKFMKTFYILAYSRHVKAEGSSW